MMRQLWPTRQKPTRPFDFVVAAFMVAAMGIPPGVIVFVLAFAAVVVAAAASTFRGGGVEVCNIIALLRESWV